MTNCLPQCAHLAGENRIMVPGQSCTVCFWQCGHLIRCLLKPRSIRSTSGITYSNDDEEQSFRIADIARVTPTLFPSRQCVGPLKNCRMCAGAHRTYSTSRCHPSICSSARNTPAQAELGRGTLENSDGHDRLARPPMVTNWAARAPRAGAGEPTADG